MCKKQTSKKQLHKKCKYKFIITPEGLTCH